ncbi:ABC transporter permease [Lysinibacillus xylanilyticus]|uniref:ABC transporter permease n=1 Tax=Lysinibacillus xylanilyticus TaxID=582475 RepID=UPI002B246FBD|nr:ABC transporter permease [Lysinibacillus xylanilyticus]MEB2302396.1 ABC transporter permease [Lysinibacillus xylanilyticus]
MTILKNNFKRILKKKSNWLLIIILPIVLMTVLVMSASSGNTYHLGISDEDQTKFTKTFIDNLSEKYEIVTLETNKVREAVINSEVDYALVFKENTTEQLINGELQDVEAYSIQESNISVPLRIYVDSYLSAARGIGIEAAGDEVKFYEGMDYYLEGKFTMDASTVSAETAKSETIMQSLGFLVLAMVLLLTFSTTSVLKDKVSGLYTRVKSGPLARGSYEIQIFLSYVLIAMFQLFLVFMIMTYGLGMDIADIFIPLYLIMLLFAVCCVALGTFVSNISNNLTQANALLNLINIPMCMLGGALWPIDIMPELLKNISVIFPTTWVLQAAEKIVQGDVMSSIGLEIIILASFTLVFLLLGVVDFKLPRFSKVPKVPKVTKNVEM